MLTALYTFSKSLTISAVSVELTGTTSSMTSLYRLIPASRHAGVTPPITFGMLCVWYVGLPGSCLSGVYTRKKSSPTLSPDSSSRSRRTTPLVVPGYVVLSSDTRHPRRSNLPTHFALSSTWLRSGDRLSSSGVGTHRTATSYTVDSSTSRTGTSHPSFTCLANFSAGKWLRYDSPASSAPIFPASVS
jgi:hypothetical protein